MSQSILQLVANSDENFTKYYPTNTVDELFTVYPISQTKTLLSKH